MKVGGVQRGKKKLYVGKTYFYSYFFITPCIYIWKMVFKAWGNIPIVNHSKWNTYDEDINN